MKGLSVVAVALFVWTAGWTSTAAGECAGSDVITMDNAQAVGVVQTIADHTDGVWNAVFSHAGNRLATCGEDGQVLIHVLDHPDSVIACVGHTTWVLGLAFSPDDQFLASTGTNGFSGTLPGVIKVWDTATGDEVRELAGHPNGSWSLDYQEGTSILASGGKDRLVKLWDPSTGGLLRNLTGHTGWVLSVDFHPTQDLVASSGIDRTIRLWNSQTGAQVRVLTGHTNNVGFVKFSPDGSTLASGADDGTVRLWDVADGHEIWNVPAGQGWINGVAFSPDGELLLSCGHNGSVVLRKAIDGSELVRLTEHTGAVLRGSFNPSGTLFATASWDNTVRVWGVCASGIPEEDSTDSLPRAGLPSQNYPNPFSSGATLSFDVPGTAGQRQHVTLTVYDLRGRFVTTLVDTELDPGSHSVAWDCRDDAGDPASPGVYLYALRGAAKTYAGKMILVR
jgi:WD40 repeat protein